MDSLFKKLDMLTDLLKAAQASFKMPKLPNTPNIANHPTGLGTTPASKKAPSRVAAQPKIQSTMKPKTSGVSFAKNGQWSLN